MMIKHTIAESLKLYGVTDRSWLREGETLCQRLEEALAGGVSFVQLREKHISDEDFLKEALEVKKLTDRYQVPFVINDNVDIAIKSGADGVHLGQDDMAVSQARHLLGADKIIGVSAHSIQEAVAAEQAGANYLGVGAVFGSSTKEDAKPLAFETLRDICASVSIPVVAIGGIGMDNIIKLKGSGIAGAAVVSALFAASDTKAAAIKLNNILEDVLI